MNSFGNLLKASGVNLSAVARRAGLTKQAIHQQVLAGRITPRVCGVLVEEMRARREGDAAIFDAVLAALADGGDQ